jgi:dipeptidyl aminopeptidase/acylaminoacyl peptidase
MRIIPATLAAALAFGSPVANAQAPVERRPAAQSAVKRPMTFEDLQAMQRVADPQISPSGRWVLFSVMDVDLARNSKVNHLWIVPTDGSAREHQLTFGEGESSGRFSPDGSRVVYVANGQLWLAAWSDAAGALARAVQLTSVVTEADAPVWSPDGQSLAFVSEIYPECSTGAIFDEACNQKATDDAAKAPTKALIFDSLLYRHWNTYQGAKRSHILMLHVARAGYIYDLTPTADWGEQVIAPTFSLGGASGYAWAPDSKEFAFVLNDDKVPAASTNNDIYVIDPTLHDGPQNHPTKGAALGWEPKKISNSPGSDDAPAYSPDGKYMAFRSQARAGYESDRFRLMLYDRKTKLTKEVSPFGGKFNDGGPLSTSVNEFAWAPDSKRIFFTQSVQDRTWVQGLGLDGQIWELDGTEGELGEIQIPSDGKSLFATSMRINLPTEIVVFDLEHPSLNSDPKWFKPGLGKTILPKTFFDSATVFPEYRVTHLNDGLISPLDLPSMDQFFFAGAGGTRVEGFLIRPPNFDPSKKYPLKFLIHGGPQGAWGDAWSYRWNAELMAASGYVVVMINPRGSTGYGRAFIDGVNGDWGGKPYIDLMRGLDYAEAKYPFIDKKRECALGASYGGFMANWILTHTSRFACIVTHDGMFNPQSAYGTTEELWFNEWEFRRPGSSEPAQPWKYAAGPIADDPFRKWSPMLSIANAKTPTLVIHSQRDYRLDVSEGFQLFTALQRLGVPSKMLYFPDEGHWVLKPQNSKLWYKTVGDWCDKWTHTNKYAKD